MSTAQGIDLYAEPGSLTALMGGSGAGKTVRAMQVLQSCVSQLWPAVRLHVL